VARNSIRQVATFPAPPASVTVTCGVLRNSARSTSGARTRRSIATNSASSASPIAASPSVRQPSQPHAAPRSIASVTHAIPATIVARPGTSTRSAEGSCDSWT